jgi:hypothetical protein
MKRSPGHKATFAESQSWPFLSILLLKNIAPNRSQSPNIWRR